jgi:hypothetical protein
VFSGHSRIKPESKPERYLENPQIFRKFKTTLLSNPKVKEEVAGNWKII